MYVSALWVSQNLSAHDRLERVASSQELLGSHTSDIRLLWTKRGFFTVTHLAN